MDENEDDDDEKRRRAALLGMGLLLPEQLANLPIAGSPPIIASTPQIAQVPVIPNTLPTSFSPAPPAIQAAAPGITQFQAQIRPPQALSASPPIQAGQYSSAPAYHSSPFRHHQSNPPHHLLKPRHRLYPQRFPGCLTIIAVFLAALVAIIGTSLALATSIFAPGLSISGSTNVAPGGILILHGHNFSSNSNVTLTFDNNVPVLVVSQALIQPSRSASRGLDSSMLALSSFQTPTATPNMISTHSDGTFKATIQIEQAWASGHHTIHATEVTSHRNASLPFTITPTVVTATPPSTPTPSPTSTLGPPSTSTPTSTTIQTPTPSPTPTTVSTPPPTLSCVTPGTLSLGPISELSSQIASASATLCTSGSGTLTWKASWDQSTAPWLQIKQRSGSVQAPHEAKITISASATTLTTGTYTTTVTFTGVESNTTQKINIALTVQKGCVQATPQILSFTGVASTSDPASSQTISLTNCALTSNWSSQIDKNSSWLSLNPGKGTLNGGDTTTITITASNLHAGLSAGTYTDSITLSIGGQDQTVDVTLTVQPAPPTISVSPTSVDAASAPCTNSNSADSGGEDSICTITLTNNSSTNALDWSWSATGNASVHAESESTTIAASGTETVDIYIPYIDCGTPVTVTFSAPGNTASVTWNCTPPTPTPTPPLIPTRPLH